MFRFGVGAMMMFALVLMFADGRTDFASTMIQNRQSSTGTMVVTAARDQLFAAFKNEIANNQAVVPPAFVPISVCNSAGCAATYTDAATYSCQASTSSVSGTSITSANLNARVNEYLASCIIKASFIVNGVSRSLPVATQMFRLYNQAPYVDLVGNLNLLGSSTAQTTGDAGGCSSAHPTQCDPNVTAAVDNTIITSTNTCTANPTECGYGQAPAGDSYSNASWLTTTANSNGAAH